MLKFLLPSASLNKLRLSANFMILGATDQKLWVFEVFRQTLGRQACAGANQQELTTCSKCGRQKKKNSKKRGIGFDRGKIGPWANLAPVKSCAIFF
jgi:hypothetical protein